jgi:predicted nucleotidyltransferase
MKYPSLPNLIEKIKSSERVMGIFTTGTTATKMNSSSDIDLVVVLDKNSEDIKAIYTMIEKRFSDIFFFDMDFLNKLKEKREVSGNNFDGIFLEWLAQGKIEYDPKNILLALKEKISKNQLLQYITDSEKKDFWVKINYNFIANSRYYNSEDKIYHQALEFRLLYSVIELITAYFSFRDIPWRGEKAAVKYLEQNDPEFLATFQKYSESSTLDEKMKYYVQLLNKSFFGKYQKWEEDFIIPISQKNGYDKNLLAFWGNLLEEQI